MAAVITNQSPELARRAAPSAPPRPREPRPLRIGLLGQHRSDPGDVHSLGAGAKLH